MKKFNSKINVLHLISSLLSGGSERLLVDLLKNSNDSEINFVVVVMNDYIDENLKKELLSTGNKVYFLNRKKSDKHPKYLFKLLKIIKANKIDIIHSHNYGSKMWAVLCKIFIPNLKTVFTVHDTGFTRINKLGIYIHKNIIDRNIAISKAVLNECISMGITNSIQIYNGINISRFSYKKTNNDIFTIINVASIYNHIKKGQDILIKALKILKDGGIKFKCNLVGNIYAYEYDKKSKEYLDKLITELKLENEVSFLGNRDDIPKLLTQSDLFILPSRYEGLGLAILEAMASGLPVIASNIDGPAELIKDGENGVLFESENYKELADKIIDLCNNHNKRDLIAQKGLEFVQNFDISKMSRKYSELYKSLMD